MRNPKAQLHLPDIDLKTVQESMLLWAPLRLLDVCPSSDGAMAMVIGSERRPPPAPGPVAWIHGTAMRSEPTMFAGRDQVNPQAGKDCAADVYRQAGITNPREDFDCAEVYVPFSWYEPMWLENLGFCAEGDGWKLTEAGATAFDGDIPWNPSGGVLSSNPIGASGMIRFGEVAQQVRERAGDYQVRAQDREGARPRVRRWLAVLLDVGRRQREARVARAFVRSHRLFVNYVTSRPRFGVIYPRRDAGNSRRKVIGRCTWLSATRSPRAQGPLRPIVFRMSDGHGDGHDFAPPPPPVMPDPAEHVVEAPAVADAERETVLHVARADGPGFSIVLPSLRGAQKPPRADDTELTQ